MLAYEQRPATKQSSSLSCKELDCFVGIVLEDETDALLAMTNILA